MVWSKYLEQDVILVAIKDRLRVRRVYVSVKLVDGK